MARQIKLGELNIPTDYFRLNEEDKTVVCNSILESILYILEKNVKDNRIDKLKILNEIIDSSIITNQHEENYEVCGVLADIRNLVNA